MVSHGFHTHGFQCHRDTKKTNFPVPVVLFSGIVDDRGHIIAFQFASAV